MFSLEEGTLLVKLAREAAEAYLDGRNVVIEKSKVEKYPNLFKNFPVFITLYEYYPKLSEMDENMPPLMLRGRSGVIRTEKPLLEVVMEHSIYAIQDRRFPQVRRDELNKIMFEVAILTSIRRIDVSDPREYLDKIELGRDGIIFVSGNVISIIMPYEPALYNIEEVEEILEMAAIKAGLPPNGWCYPFITIYTFTPAIFAEKKPRGEVIRREPHVRKPHIGGTIS